ncbi:MAG: DMT family transporter [Oscillospiraceae bacterium]|nr:DMT family transporter [Oscillospiraceae bacterium]
MKDKLIRQIICPLLAALIWGTAFVAQRVCAESVPPFAFNAIRSVIAFLFLLLVSRAFDTSARRRGTSVPRTDWKMLLTGGIFCGIFLSFSTNLQQVGIANSSAGKAGFITAFYVVLVPVFGIFLKKRAGVQVWGGVALAVAGLYLLCIQAGEGFDLQPSDFYLLLCAVFFALQILCVDHFVQFVDGIRLSCIQFAVNAVVSTALSLGFETVDWSAAQSCTWPLLYMGIGSCGVAYTLQIISQRGSNPTVVTLLFSLESVFSVLAGAVLLNEVLSVREYAGCVLMFIAVVLAQIPLPQRHTHARLHPHDGDGQKNHCNP